ncbi:MAG TPA: hypothetical protein VG122_21775 [Gemmata sp.]|jgi:hypothetical protein|nr:hypothetical protein [Gemmata sp.]
MKRGYQVVLFTLAMVTGTLFYFYLVVLPQRNLLRRSTEEITAAMLQLTPLGSQRADVQNIVNHNGWGFGQDFKDPPGTIGVVLGGYDDLIFDTTVFAYWVFDDQDKLQKIRVTKMWLGAP